ncbi:MAG TPA: S1 RNA-binding domain-containing protein [Candidatus Scybalocola faecigallinarum]|uniref:S1 RNA-binding domain-containing protein n=1 Tax=Candidatus Scybalocola faecigallinarum TaxID=2840941 RepID=A0A9D1F4G3_9FIRM|nr:S1 RNA-binding domain-containing protein [Candidatus Scybalocola faecigallinarum]
MSEESMMNEAAETMETYEKELEQSLVQVKEGDLVTGTVAGVADTEVTVDLGIYSEGIIKLAELSNDPKFSIKKDIAPGDTVKAVVLSEDDGEGHILLSKKKADDILAWDGLQEMMNNGTVLTQKIGGVVKGGVVTYVNGIRGFIPASQLALGYVEDLNTFLNQTVEAKIITVDPEKKRLVLSVKEVEREKAQQERQAQIARIQVGDVMEGKVETITGYGAFIDLGNGISGLVHISQISQKRIQSVHEVLKEGDDVKVKVIAVKDGKLSLSMKALQENTEVTQSAKEETFHYKEEGKATTGLGSILAGLKLDL